MTIDIGTIFPKLKHELTYLVNMNSEEYICDQLVKNGFKVYKIDGGKIFNEQSFFEEAAKGLKFPDYFGHNWDAFDECICDYVFDETSGPATIIIRDADKLAKTNLQLFLDIMKVLVEWMFTYRYGINLKSGKVEFKSIQVELFLTGSRVEFKEVG